MTRRIPSAINSEDLAGRPRLPSRRTWLLLVALSFFSCGGTVASRRTFPLVVSPAGGALVTDSGWTVTLTSARASLGAARFYSGKVPSIARRTPRINPLEWLVSSAWAHPGHYVPGEAMGELLRPLEVDLLQAETAWGEVSGVTGAYGSMEVTVAAGGVRLAGTATKDTQTVSFDTGAFTPPAAIQAIVFEHQMDTSSGRVRLTVDLRTIVSRMDFAQVGAGANPLDSTSPAFNGFARGVEDSSAWRGTWEAP
ncbi:MAG: hypothetical protein AB1730_07100 [Myxococcota bacterium]